MPISTPISSTRAQIDSFGDSGKNCHTEFGIPYYIFKNILMKRVPKDNVDDILHDFNNHKNCKHLTLIYNIINLKPNGTLNRRPQEDT